MKNNPYDNFTEAIDLMVFSEKPMQDRVLDAYTKLDAGFRWALSQHYRLNFAVDNLLNENII